MTPVVVMGPAGCGKTTIGRRLADAWGVEFIDADDHHSRENIEKMRAGIGLTDEDRKPWLESLSQILKRQPRTVLACSALKKSYRNMLREGAPSVRFLMLKVPEPELLGRLESRAGHFAGRALMESQLETLEEPIDEEDAAVVDADGPTDRVLERATLALGLLRR